MAGFDYGKAIGAVGDLFGGVGKFLGGQAGAAASEAQAQGLGKEAEYFRKAAEIEQWNGKYAAVSGDLTDVQTGRKIYQSISGTRSDLAGSGVAESGSGLDVLRSSAQQGALSHAMIGMQTDINVNNYKAQETAYLAQAEAADAAASSARASAGGQSSAGIFGGIGSALSGIATLASFLPGL